MSTSTCNLQNLGGGGGSGLDYVILLSQGLDLDYGGVGGKNDFVICERPLHTKESIIYIMSIYMSFHNTVRSSSD